MTIEYYNNARALLDSRDVKEAIPLLKKCYEKLKDSPAYSSYCANQLALTYEKGATGIAINHFKANEFYKKAYLVEKSEVNIFNYASSLIKLSFYEESLPILNECLTSQASKYKSWCANQMALLHEHEKIKDSSFDDALYYHKSAYAYNKADFFNLYNLAMIYHKAQHKDAKTYLHSCAKHDNKEHSNYRDSCIKLLQQYKVNPHPNQQPDLIELSLSGEDMIQEI